MSTANPFDEVYAKELEQSRAMLVPEEKARDIASCIAGHAAYNWAFHDLPGFNTNDCLCHCGLHKERLGK